jgi:hypothetical protein
MFAERKSPPEVPMRHGTILLALVLLSAASSTSRAAISTATASRMWRF